MHVYTCTCIILSCQVAVPKEPMTEELPVEPETTPTEEREGESPQMSPGETPPPVPEPPLEIEQVTRVENAGCHEYH